MTDNYFDPGEGYRISPALLEKAREAEELCAERFREIDDIAAYNGEKVLHAFISRKVGAMHLSGTTGYGYDDVGRDKLDEVFAAALGAEDALVRHHFVNGTHALSTALFGVLRPGQRMVSLTGRPYDTLSEVIFGERGGSLREFGIGYDEVRLTPEGRPDFAGIRAACRENCAVAYIQRSRGYSLRPSLSVEEIGEIAKAVREINPKSIIMVDNCYGEFCERTEPTQVGADLIIGSLIKNPGGGIAETGGYIAGRRDLVELCANRLTSVGIGREAGCSLGQNRGMFLGLFLAPQTVANALKTSVFAAALLELLGYKAYPRYTEKRTDIIAAFALGGKEALISFCKGIQVGSPVDSFASPEPWAMPGYDSEVIMAAGAFTMGASIELSADAPLREPYAVWLQGGLTYPTGRMGILRAVESMKII